MISVDSFLGRVYHPRQYNCAHLVCEVWQALTGKDLSTVLSGFLCAPRARQIVLSELRGLKFLSVPHDPCVVLMQSPHGRTHVGVWLRGRVLQITEQGVQFVTLDVARVGFNRIRFFKC